MDTVKEVLARVFRR